MFSNGGAYKRLQVSLCRWAHQVPQAAAGSGSFNNTIVGDCGGGDGGAANNAADTSYADPAIAATFSVN